MKHVISYNLFESESKKLYHGNRKGNFPPRRKRFAGSIFLTDSLEFAKNFAGFDERSEFPNGAVWQVELLPGLKICDVTDSDEWKKLDLKSIIQKMIDSGYVDPANGKKFGPRGKGFKGFDPEKEIEFDLEDSKDSVYNYLWLIKNGVWQIIECEPVVDSIKRAGYDGFEVVEKGVKNLAIFDEGSIKGFSKIL
jgi:hypothetical protein